MKYFFLYFSLSCFLTIKSNSPIPSFKEYQSNFKNLTWRSSLFPSRRGFGWCSYNSDPHIKKKKISSTEIHLHRVYNKVPHTAFKRRNISERGRLKFSWSTPNEKLFNFNRLFYCQVLHMPSVFIDLNSKDADKTLKMNKHKTQNVQPNWKSNSFLTRPSCSF